MINPDIAPRIYSNIKIDIFSFKFLLLLNNTKIAVPEPVKSPLINDGKLMALFKYNSVNITLAPQFGISPIKLVTNGANMLSFNNNFDNRSSPIYVKIVLIMKFIIRINTTI